MDMNFQVTTKTDDIVRHADNLRRALGIASRLIKVENKTSVTIEVSGFGVTTWGESEPITEELFG